MDSGQTIHITLNGEAREVPGSLTVSNLLAYLEITADRVAVELNRSIVRKPEWAGVQIEDGAQIEVVQFVGGG